MEELRRNWTQMEDAAFKWKFSPKHARLKEAMRMYPKAPARGADWFALFLNKLYQVRQDCDLGIAPFSFCCVDPTRCSQLDAGKV